MRRTQSYLDDQLWHTLHLQARRQRTTISALVREAVRERYPAGREERKNAMENFVGIRAHGPDRDAVEYVQKLRQGGRLDRLRRK